MQRRYFKSCEMHFAISYCLWARSMKTFTITSATIDQPMRQKAEASKTKKKNGSAELDAMGLEGDIPFRYSGCSIC